MDKKKCARCKRVYPLEHFARRRSSKDGLQRWCNLCMAEAQTNYRKKHPEAVERQKNRQREKRKILKEQQRLSKVIRDRYKSREDLTQGQFEEMNRRQKGLCAICNKPCPKNTRLSIDHDHTTGKVRGLLCNRCNVGLAYFHEDAELLLNASVYLRG